MVEERDINGVLSLKYVHGPGSDELISKTGNGGQTYQHHDRLGSAVLLTDAAGNVAERYSYDAAGDVVIRDSFGSPVGVSPTGNRFMFTGREYRGEMGIYDLRNRVYSARIGRFLQTDLIRFKAGDNNLYRYVFNSSVNATDPFGLEWHHLLPVQVFGSMTIPGVNINKAEYGWELGVGPHRLKGGLHSSGWNDAWQDWVDNMNEKGKKINKIAVDCKLNKMKTVYSGLISQGAQATRNYPKGLNYGKSVKKKMGSGRVYLLVVAYASGASGAAAERAESLMREMEYFYGEDGFGEQGLSAATISHELSALFGVNQSLAAAALLHHQ